MLQFVSRDVTFHEHIFPFTPHSTTSYMQPLPNPNPQNPTGSHIDDMFLQYPSDNDDVVTNSPPPATSETSDQQSSPQKHPVSTSPHASPTAQPSPAS